MLNDAHREVRYNAANALARLGSSTSLDTLQEMLDIEHLRKAGLPEDQLGNVPFSALRALERLLLKTPQADLAALRPNIASLTRTGTTLVRISARKLLIELDNSTPTASQKTKDERRRTEDSR